MATRSRKPIVILFIVASIISFVVVFATLFFSYLPTQAWNESALIGECEIVPDIQEVWCDTRNGVTTLCFEAFSYLRVKNFTKNCGTKTYRGLFASKKLAEKFLTQFIEPVVKCYFSTDSLCEPLLELKTSAPGATMIVMFGLLGIAFATFALFVAGNKN